MWILNFIPDWVFYVMFVASMIGFVCSQFMPPIYRKAVQVTHICFFFLSIFMIGAIYDNHAWVKRVEEMEAKVAVAEQQAKEANEKINSKTQDQTRKIEEKQIVIKEYIDREVAKFNEQCVIPKEFIKALNDSAEGIK